MDNTSDYKELHVDNTTFDAAQMQLARDNVYKYFGVSEKLINGTYDESEFIAFYESVIEQFAIQFSETMTAAAFTETEIQRGSYIMLTANRLQYLSTTEKLNVSAQMADRGIMNRDEIREIWNLPPIPDGAGQAYTIRGEYYLMNEDGTFTKEGV
jgi:phage portal protein BeeE